MEAPAHLLMSIAVLAFSLIVSTLHMLQGIRYEGCIRVALYLTVRFKSNGTRKTAGTAENPARLHKPLL